MSALLRNARVRSWFWQFVLLVAVLGTGAWLFGNTLENLATRNIRVGFGFLQHEAGFEIAESVISYQAGDTYARAFAVGLFNTLKVALIGIVLATVLGVLIGIARLSTNWLLARLAASYVELLRNIPLLLQLFVWYGVLTEWLPGVRQAWTSGDLVVLSQRGLRLAWPAAHAAWPWVGLAVLVAIAVALLWHRLRAGIASRRGYLRILSVPTCWLAVLMLLLLPLAVWWLAGAPTDMDRPVLRGFNHVGGLSVSPELAALLIGLSTYTAAFIAEVVRAGLQSVERGQTDAASALGLNAWQRLWLVVMPQALRAILPPLTNQYLNLAKNSSLAVAIGYPDLVSVANTSMNQTGQAIEAIAILMLVYLSISLSIAVAMNLYAAHTRQPQQ